MPLDSTPPRWLYDLATALSLGWGIRGEFGHEYGPMIPGPCRPCRSA